MLKSQMENRKELEREARMEYEKEKAVVDRQVQKLIEEERRKIEVEQEKKRQLYNIMVDQYKAKEQMRAQVMEADRR